MSNVQAERLKELAALGPAIGPRYWTLAEQREVARLLDGQAEQIDRLTKERDEWQATAETLQDKDAMAQLLAAEQEERAAVEGRLATLTERIRKAFELRDHVFKAEILAALDALDRDKDRARGVVKTSWMTLSVSEPRRVDSPGDAVDRDGKPECTCGTDPLGNHDADCPADAVDRPAPAAGDNT